jgi:hypothetical protein
MVALRYITNTPVKSSCLRNYFAYQQHQSQRRLRLLFRDGRTALIVGLVFLFVCIVIRQLAYSFGARAASEIVAEGMFIAGWVAMWRRLDIFWPIRRHTRVLGKLSAMPVVMEVP